MTQQLLLLLLAAHASSSSLFQQGQVPPAPAPSLRLDVVAIDSAGVPVTDLRPAEFEVWISGYRVPIADVYAPVPDRPRTLVLLLDDTAAGPDLAQRVRTAARAFVEQKAADDQLTVITLNGRGAVTTTDRAQLIQAIDRYNVQGVPFRLEDAGAHVLQAMASLARQLPERTGGRNTIVAIGSAWLFDTPMPPPALGDLTREWVAAMRTMAATHTSLYVFDPSGVGMSRGSAAYGGASGFAHETGGYAFLNTNDMDGTARRILAEAGAYYVLAMANPPVQRTADLRQVEVKVLRKGVTVRARRGIKGRD
jgi:VWFA-related protein